MWHKLCQPYPTLQNYVVLILAIPSPALVRPLVSKACVWPSSKSYTKIMQTLVTSKNLWHIGTDWYWHVRYSMISMGPRVSKIQILEMWAYWIWLALSNWRLEPVLGTENGWKWRYCWLKSCTTWDVWKPINHGINMDKLPINYRISAINNSNWNLSKRCSNFSWRWLCISLCSSKSRITVASIAVHCPWNINERTQKNLKFNKIP